MNLRSILRLFRASVPPTPADSITVLRERDGKPMYSLIHASIRPEKWRATFDEWLSKCERPEDVEYILCVDAADAERFDVNRLPSGKGFTFRMVVNHGRRCNVDAWNHAASVSEGHIIIAVSDDTGACEGWDSKVGLAIPRTPLGAAFVVNLRQEFIIDIFTGSPNRRPLFEIPIVSRSRYQRLGYYFYPAYRGMYADVDMYEQAARDGVIVNARHLFFPHRHPFFDKGVPMDEEYARHNHQSEYDFGKLILEERRQNGFTPVKQDHPWPPKRAVVEVVVPPAPKGVRVIHLLMPGEQFTGAVMINAIGVVVGLLGKGFAVVPHNFHCSNVYIARNYLAQMALSIEQGDYIVWMDDDNIANVNQVRKLIEELDSHPEADMVAGWTWIQADFASCGPKASCGIFDEKGFLKTIAKFHCDGEPELYEVEWTGFPVVAMRREALVKAGRNPFAPMPSSEQDIGFGYYGEDVAFCLRLRKAGGRIFVDPSVYVPHFKLREALPAVAPVPVPDDGGLYSENAPAPYS